MSADNPHRFALLTALCVGCDVAARDVADLPPAGSRKRRNGVSLICPARYADIPADCLGAVSVVVAPDRAVILLDGEEHLRLHPDGVRALIEALGFVQ